MADPQYLKRLSIELADNGRIIEAGWIALRISLGHTTATPEMLSMFRDIYMSGAQHLFASIMTILDDDIEPTPNDMHRLTLIAKELEAFAYEMQLRHAPPEGTA